MHKRLAVLILLVLAASASATPPSPEDSSPDVLPTILNDTCDQRLRHYPLDAKLRNLQSTTKLSVYVDAKGTVMRTEVLSSSGSVKLDVTTELLIASCRFKPALRSGTPVPAGVKIEYVWKIE